MDQVLVSTNSNQLRAVLTVITADEELKRSALPLIDIQNESIDWQRIFKLSLDAGERAALVWAYAMWRDELPSKANIFETSFKMDQHLRSAVMRALSIRWNV